ncbi:hypothetical protein EG103P1_00080 [Enterococcus phage EG103P1]|nr:hypothetical protein EG103P1_00080 [Enterococcus phage EG103P1]
MARKMGKKKRQELLEAFLTDVMIDTQKDFADIIGRYSPQLEAVVDKIIIEAMKESPDYMLIQDSKSLLEYYTSVYGTAFKEELTKAFTEVAEKVVGHPSLGEGIASVDITNAIQEIIEEAYDYFFSILLPILYELEGVATGTVVLGESQGKLAHLEQLRDNLLYFLRRHIEAQASVIINLAVVEASKQYEITLWKWSNRPELTVSGVCEHCKSLAHGGIRNEGLYTLETLPLLPVHPHCVCIIVPVIS